MTGKTEPEEARDMSPASIMLRLTVGLIGLVFCAGALVGFTKAANEHGAWSISDYGIALLIAAVAMGFVWLGWTGLRGALANKTPIAPSEGKTRQLIWASCALGSVLAAVMIIGGGIDGPGFAGNPVFSNSPLPPAVVFILLAGLALTVVLTVQWHRVIDEHEGAAYNFGGIAALYAYFIATPAWWLLWRGGMMPEPNAMLVLLGVTGVWMAGWLWKRSH